MYSAAPGEPCSEKVACSPFSVCENNVCKCVNNMMIRDKMCVQRRKVNIGNSCNNEDQCLGNSTCMDNNCQCGIGFVASMDVCVLRKTGKPNFCWFFSHTLRSHWKYLIGCEHIAKNKNSIFCQLKIFE